MGLRYIDKKPSCQPNFGHVLESDHKTDPSEKNLFCRLTCRTKIPTERTAKTDQTGRMPRLIWVFAGRTDHFLGFVMRRLISFWFWFANDRQKWSPDQNCSPIKLKQNTKSTDSTCTMLTVVSQDTNTNDIWNRRQNSASKGAFGSAVLRCRKPRVLGHATGKNFVKPLHTGLWQSNRYNALCFMLGLFVLTKPVWVSKRFGELPICWH